MGRQYTVSAYLELVDRLRSAIPDIALTTDVIVGFCGETEGQFESTLRLLERVRYDQVFAAAYSERPGTPATRLADDVPADDKRRRLNALLALQEPIGLERNRAWLGRAVEVLVDTIVPPRAHEHEADEPALSSDRAPGAELGSAGDVHLSGRTRQNKLVHLAGPASWLGSLATVRVDHAGPYALRGTA
jgi:tRNA-2-methylthio-N6-dimethylallyladenosine synthase